MTTRTYTLKRRAEQQAETRQRIVEAAVELHSSVGPANTTLTMIAERAGVQRHTLYAHFPDERCLSMACSALTMERSPMPDADAWRTIANSGERLRTGLSATYRWFESNEALLACVLRDAEHHVLTREIVGLRMNARFESYRNALGEGFSQAQGAMLWLALSFFTWRTLARDARLGTEAAAAAMTEAVLGAG